MQALRKSSAEMAVSHRTPVREDASAPQLAGDHAATQSPALALRAHLAARLDQMSHSTAGNVAVADEPSIDKLPMQARMLVIVGLSLALWLGLYAAVVAVV